MKLTIEVPATPEAQRHLNRNPRVLTYADSDRGPVFEVTINTSIAIPRIIAAEARQLDLDADLSRVPHS